jgi:F-type H+-transporting ATPase subunit b
MEYADFHGVFWEKGAFWVTVAVVIFAVVFGRKIIGAIVNMLDQRSAAIAAALQEAANLRAEAEAMLKDAERRRAEAEARAQAMIAAAAHEAEHMAAEFMKDAELQAKRRERMALDRIAAAEASAVAELRARATDLAVRATEISLRETVDAEHDRAMIDQAISGLPTAFRRSA